MQVTIYGKDGCPYTLNARRGHEAQGDEVEYINVLRDPEALRRMMALTGGQRRVPVIVQGDTVTVGFGGT